MPSLLEALERKYCADDDVTTTSDTDDITSSSPPQEALVSIYMPKLPPLQIVPELLVLNDCDIDSAGDCDAIKEKCRRVRELDLAQNKLQDWNEVFHILAHMPRIEFLNLSKNRLNGPLGGGASPPISNLRNIVLNGTYLNWRCVDVLLDNLPVLEELHLSLNDYKDVLIDTAATESCCSCGNGGVSNTDEDSGCSDSGTGADEDELEVHMDSLQTSTTTASGCRDCDALRNCKKINAHKALKTLHFTGNPIENWCEICRLGRVFPNLQNLVLAECPIRSIALQTPAIDTTADTTKSTATAADDAAATSNGDTEIAPPYKYFSNLLFLNLSCANINTWDDIDRLARFPQLRHLRVKNWPLWERLECTEHERRQLLIARLPNVQILNGGGVIGADEREVAERAFVRYYMEKPEAERPTRYAELFARYGPLDPLVDVNLKPEKRIKVILRWDTKSEERLVDIYRTVKDLKERLEKIIGLPANKMRLYYLDQDYKDFGPEEMKYPNKQLYSYNIQAGDEIIIDEKK